MQPVGQLLVRRWQYRQQHQCGDPHLQGRSVATGVDYRSDPRFLACVEVGFSSGSRWASGLSGQGTTVSQSGFRERRGRTQSQRGVADDQVDARHRGHRAGGRRRHRLARQARAAVRLGWVHEYADTSRPVTASIAGAPGANFTVFGASPQRDSTVLGFPQMPLLPTTRPFIFATTVKSEPAPTATRYRPASGFRGKRSYR